jgi:hypothetical protein
VAWSGSFFGFEAFVNIPEGEATDVVRIRNTGQMHRLDFQIRCDDFKLTLYENRGPQGIPFLPVHPGRRPDGETEGHHRQRSVALPGDQYLSV